jgi:hypothetical protein
MTYHPATTLSLDLLADWRWLLGGLPHLCGWASSGDLFYSDDRGRVWRLDTGAGETNLVAESSDSFEEMLLDPSCAEALLLLPVLRAFEMTNGPLSAGHCLGFTTLPVFGGAYTADNRYAISVVGHASFTGDMHRQIRDLPDGAVIRLKVIP